MLAVAESIVTGHGVAVPAGFLGSLGVDGRFYSNWYPLLSFLAVPLVLFGRMLASMLHLPFHFVAAVCALSLSAVMTAAAAGVVVLLAHRFGASARGACLAAVCFAFGTIALVYARTFFAEPLLALLFVAAFFFAVQLSPGAVMAASALAALAVLTKPTGIILGPILSAYLLMKRRKLRVAALPACGAILGLAVYGLYNQVRFGNPLRFGPPWNFGLAYVPGGIGGLLFSPQYGLLWYSPAAILALYGIYLLARKHPPEALAAFALILGQLFIHSIWQYWSGGWSWGPRFLVPILPVLFSVAGQFEGKLKKAFLILALAGFVINAPTLFSYYERYFSELNEQPGAVAHDLTWSFDKAPWLHGWPAAVREVQDARTHNVVELFHSRNGPAHAIRDSRALQVVAIWWWVLPVAKIPRWVGIVAALLMCAAGARAIQRAFSLANQPAESNESPGISPPSR